MYFTPKIKTNAMVLEQIPLKFMRKRRVVRLQLDFKEIYRRKDIIYVIFLDNILYYYITAQDEKTK